VIALKFEVHSSVFLTQDFKKILVSRPPIKTWAPTISSKPIEDTGQETPEPGNENSQENYYTNSRQPIPASPGSSEKKKQKQEKIVSMRAVPEGKTQYI